MLVARRHQNLAFTVLYKHGRFLQQWNKSDAFFKRHFKILTLNKSPLTSETSLLPMLMKLWMNNWKGLGANLLWYDHLRPHILEVSWFLSKAQRCSHIPAERKSDIRDMNHFICRCRRQKCIHKLQCEGCFLCPTLLAKLTALRAFSWKPWQSHSK